MSARYQEGDAVEFQPETRAAWRPGTFVNADRTSPRSTWYRVRDAFGVVYYVPNRRVRPAPAQTHIRFAAVQIEGSGDSVAELGSILADALSPKKDTP